MCIYVRQVASAFAEDSFGNALASEVVDYGTNYSAIKQLTPDEKKIYNEWRSDGKSRGEALNYANLNLDKKEFSAFGLMSKLEKGDEDASSEIQGIGLGKDVVIDEYVKRMKETFGDKKWNKMNVDQRLSASQEIINDILEKNGLIGGVKVALFDEQTQKKEYKSDNAVFDPKDWTIHVGSKLIKGDLSEWVDSLYHETRHVEQTVDQFRVLMPELYDKHKSDVEELNKNPVVTVDANGVKHTQMVLPMTSEVYAKKYAIALGLPADVSSQLSKLPPIVPNSDEMKIGAFALKSKTDPQFKAIEDNARISKANVLKVLHDDPSPERTKLIDDYETAQYKYKHDLGVEKDAFAVEKQVRDKWKANK